MSADVAQLVADGLAGAILAGLLMMATASMLEDAR